MQANIAFIGGIHGVGKSTICLKICEETKLEYLSASELIKWRDINIDPRNKKVKDIPATQDRLLVGLSKATKEERSYLLDGHYCLLNSQNEIVNIPLITFKAINPVSLNAIIGDIYEVQHRLESRDKKSYDLNLIKKMQDHEMDHANQISKDLGVDLYLGTQSDFAKVLDSLRKLFC